MYRTSREVDKHVENLSYSLSAKETLQAAAAQKITEEKEAKLKPVETMAPLLLPKHLQGSSRADSELSDKVAEATQAKVNVSQDSASTATDNSQYIEEEAKAHDDEAYEDDDEYGSAPCSNVGQATVSDSRSQVSCPVAQVLLLRKEVDDVLYLKASVTDLTTGELLADVNVDANTEFKMSGQTCSWTGFDYTIGPEPLERTVSVYFPDESSAIAFYHSCVIAVDLLEGEFGN